MKIAYFGFDMFYDCLEVIDKSRHKLVKIFTCDVDPEYESTDKIFQYAFKNNVDITSQKITRDMITELENDGCELIISAGYYHKIPVSEKIPSVNIHPAFLPEGKGSWPQPVTILKSLEFSGVTIHEITEQFDSGNIVLQEKISLDAKENLDTLTCKGVTLATKLLTRFLEDPYFYISNSHAQEGGAYWKEPSIEDMTVSKNDSFEKIDRVTRAFYGYKCYFLCDNKTISIRRAICIENQFEMQQDAVCVFDIEGGKLVVLELA